MLLIGTQNKVLLMLGLDINTDRIPIMLENRLVKVDNIIKMAGGRLVSRQVIANIIYDYQMHLSSTCID